MKSYVLLSLALLLTACAQESSPSVSDAQEEEYKSQMRGFDTFSSQVSQTQLQVREFQTRTFDTAQTEEVQSAIAEALLDEGFLVKGTGPLISANKDAHIADPKKIFFEILFFLPNAATWQAAVTIDAVIKVKKINERTKVRAIFHSKITNNHGGVEATKLIEDPKFYQDFFNRVGKSLFIEKQNL